MTAPDIPLYIVDIHHAGYYGWGVWAGPNAPEQWTAETVERLDRHPGYRMGINLGAQTYEENPRLAERIRGWLERYEDRIGISGGDYAQITSCVRGDESNLRQLIIGIETIERTLDVRPRLWTMSEPGNFAQLPQILADLGYDGALLRIHGPGQGGSATTTADAGVVWWEGPDGTHLPAVPEYTSDRLSRQNDATESMWMMTRYRNERAARGNYTLDDLLAWKHRMEERGVTPVVLSKDDDHNDQLSNNNLCMTCGHLLAADTEGDDRFEWLAPDDLLQKLPQPREIFHPTAELFETRKRSFCDYGYAGNADWIADLDADNRLRDAEFAQVLCAEVGDQEPCRDSVRELSEAWKLHLGAQNHDLSLKRSLDLMYHLQYQSMRKADTVREAALRPLLANIHTGGRGAIVVVNPLGWKRREYATVTLPAKAAEGTVLHDGNQAVAWEILRREAELVTMGFVAETPPLGYQVYRLVEGDPEKKGLVADGLAVRTDDLTVTFLAEGGIESLAVRDGRGIVEPGSVVLEGDIGGESVRSAGSLKLIPPGAVSVVAEEEGRLGSTHRYMIRYRVANGVPYVMLDIRIEPHYVDPTPLGSAGDPERKVALVARLAQHLALPDCYRRQPFLAVPYDAANDPVFAAVHWCDYHKDGHGLAVLNRGSIGQQWNGGSEIGTILWTGGCRGMDFQLALMPHASTEQVHRAGECYAAPLSCTYEPAHAGRLPSSLSVLTIEPDNVTVSSAFRMEGASHVRLWEHAGRTADLRFLRDGNQVAARRVTLEGQPSDEMNSIRPYQIATFRIP